MLSSFSGIVVIYIYKAQNGAYYHILGLFLPIPLLKWNLLSLAFPVQYSKLFPVSNFAPFGDCYPLSISTFVSGYSLVSLFTYIPFSEFFIKRLYFKSTWSTACLYYQ